MSQRSLALVATIPKEAGSVACCNRGQRGTDRVDQRINRPGSRLAPSVLEFGERLLNRRQIRRIRGQEPQLTAARADAGMHTSTLVRTQIVYHHNLTRA